MTSALHVIAVGVTEHGDIAESSAFATAAYLFACACFVLALKWLSAPATARRGNLIGEIGMLAAIVGALLHHNIIHYQWIVLGFVIGSLIGVPMAVFMPM